MLTISVVSVFIFVFKMWSKTSVMKFFVEADISVPKIFSLGVPFTNNLWELCSADTHKRFECVLEWIYQGYSSQMIDCNQVDKMWL